MATQLHIPVIGSGSIGKRHYNNLVGLNASSELLSFRSEGKAGVESRLKQGVADGVVIATATHVREELIKVCVEFDVPMYIEKPLAFTSDQVARLFEMCPAGLQQRSMVGYMMRYHPLFLRLCDQNLDDTYRFCMTIGHDVMQWRSNWRFSDSYASNPQGGGVLLDLCHELDMAHTLFPRVEVKVVNSIGHQRFPGIDFSSDVILLGENGGVGSVSMDYLSPVSTRVATFFGNKKVTQVDFNALYYETNDGQNMQRENFEFERNTMFVDAMKDFLRMINGDEVSAECPRLDRVESSVAFVANAWQRRQFNGYLSHPVL